MNQINVESILGVNGYHISGQIRVRDRELVAQVVQEQRDEIAVLRARLGQLAAENDMLKDTMIRACVWLDVHGRPGIPDVTRTLSEAVAATVKKEAHNEPRT